MTTVTLETCRQLRAFLDRYQTTAAQVATLLIQQEGSLTSSARKILCTLLLTTAAYLKLDLERTKVQLRVGNPIKPLPSEEQAYQRKSIEQELAADTQRGWELPVQPEELEGAVTLFRAFATACSQKQDALVQQQATWIGGESTESLSIWLESLQDWVLRLETQAETLRSSPQKQAQPIKSAPRKALISTGEIIPAVDLPSSENVGVAPKMISGPMLFVSQPAASLLVTSDPKHPGRGYQTLISRGRNTTYRGPVAIYATKHGARTTYLMLLEQNPLVGLPAFPRGVLVGVVELVNCRKPSQDFTQLAREWQEVGSYQLPLSRYPAQIPTWFKKGMTWLWEFRNPIGQILPPPEPLKPWRGGNTSSPSFAIPL